MSIRAAAILLSVLLPACAGLPHATGSGGGSDGAPSHDPVGVTIPDSGPAWLRSDLFFGLGREDGAATRPQDAPIDDARWRAFLDAEVTPRFPDGLTVLEARGQWRFRDGAGPERLRTRVLVILHEDTAARRADIEDIRQAWKRATGHESVLWSRHPVEVSF